MKKAQLERLAYRPVDAAAVCGVSDRTFAYWLKSDNPPPYFKRGGVILVPRLELEQWLSQQASEFDAPKQSTVSNHSATT